MLLFFHFNLIAAAVATEKYYKESVVTNTNNEVSKDPDSSCDNIFMDVNDVTFKVLNYTENKVLLNVSSAFEKNNVEGVSIARCIKSIEVKSACGTKKCCHHLRQSQEDESTSTDLVKSPPKETFIIHPCEKQKYVCISYMTFKGSKWHHKVKKLDGLPPCKESCDNLSWSEYKKRLDTYHIHYGKDEETGKYMVDWVSGLQGLISAGCLSQVALCYCTPTSDHYESKLSTIYSNVTTNQPIALKTDICGNMCVKEAFFMFKKGNQVHIRKLDGGLKDVPECPEESTIWTYLGIVIGIIVGVILIAFLFCYLFKSDMLTNTID